MQALYKHRKHCRGRFSRREALPEAKAPAGSRLELKALRQISPSDELAPAAPPVSLDLTRVEGWFTRRHFCQDSWSTHQ